MLYWLPGTLGFRAGMKLNRSTVQLLFYWFRNGPDAFLHRLMENEQHYLIKMVPGVGEMATRDRPLASD